MIKSNKNVLLTAAFLVCGIIGFTGCPASTTSNNTAIVVNKSVNSTDVVKTEPAGDKVGVPECDEYIEKYEACLNTKVPEAQRSGMKTAFESVRKSWKDAAATPQGKSGLATACKQIMETTKQSTSAYGCAW